MTKSEEILINHLMSMRDEFLITDKDRRFKQGILDAMKEYKDLDTDYSELKSKLEQTVAEVEELRGEINKPYGKL